MIKKALSINLSDTSCQTGIQADLMSFQEANVFGFTAITALSTNGKNDSLKEGLVNPSIVEKQLESVFAGGPMDAIKIGHLNSLEEAKIIKHFITLFKIKAVVLEVSIYDLEKENYQLLLPLTQAILIKETVSLTNHELTHQLVQSIGGLTTYLLIPYSDATGLKNYFVFQKNSPTKFSFQHTNMSALVTTELARNQDLNSLIK